MILHFLLCVCSKHGQKTKYTICQSAKTEYFVNQYDTRRNYIRVIEYLILLSLIVLCNDHIVYLIDVN